jgi:hypothetical protein
MQVTAELVDILACEHHNTRGERDTRTLQTCRALVQKCVSAQLWTEDRHSTAWHLITLLTTQVQRILLDWMLCSTYMRACVC